MTDLTAQAAAYLRQQIAALETERLVLQAALDVLEPPPAKKPEIVRPSETRKLLPATGRPHRRPRREPVSPDDVLALVHKGITRPSEIGARLNNAHYMTVTHTLRALAKDGQVRQLDKGVWVEVTEQNWTELRANEVLT